MTAVFLERHSGRLALLLLTLMGALMLGNSWHKKLSYDEPNNLQYGRRFLTEGPLAEPDGQRMPVLALHAAGCMPFQCDDEILRRSDWARVAVRWPSMFFALLTGVLIYIWAKKLYGRAAALAALLLYTLNPNFIAHGKELTSDTAVSFFVLLSIFCFWRFLRSYKKRDLVWTAVSTALAILSKFSALLLLPIFALLYAIHVLLEKKPVRLMPVLAALAASGLIVLFLINAAYGFQGSFMKASDYHWQSRSYQKFSHLKVPVPVPKIFALGLDTTRYLEENPQTGRGNNYILGKLHRKGRWFAFPVMVGLKTPLALFLLILLAAKRKKKTPSLLPWFFWIPFGVWMLIFSLCCNAQLGIRYVLPALSFPILYASALFAPPFSKMTKRAAVLLLGWYAVSSLSYYPHMISYFNEAIGPRVNAYKYLADSNLDWEDKDYFIAGFQAHHPELNARFSAVPAPGYLIVPANDLTGVLDARKFEWLRKNFSPLQHITYSHYLFYIPPGRVPELIKQQESFS